MPNYDEAILRRRVVNPLAPFPVLHQAVRIAFYDEYAARSFYNKVLEAYGAKPPFEAIARSELRHVAALTELADRYGIPRPLDPFPGETQVSPTWRQNCERAIAGEIANVQLYAYLKQFVSEPDVNGVFSNLQAASFNNHLPAFQRALAAAVAQEQYHASRGIPPQAAYVKHGMVTDFIERALAGLGPTGRLVSPLVKHAHPALLAGMATGTAGVLIYRKKHST
ncbi:MAG: ferritin [Burkholderiaceae bacterium]|nr:ferritin [Burkholderiaceae bacterium]